MNHSLTLFSGFVSDLNDRAPEMDAEGLAHWAVNELSRTIGFDCAWYGWAQVEPESVEIHANSTLNLPEGYFEAWQEMSSQDLLAAAILENPGGTATYDRSGHVHTDGMVALADAFGLRKMATAMESRPGRAASFYLSGYRGGGTAKPWGTAELEYLQCAIDQLSSTMRFTANRNQPTEQNGSVSVFVNTNGIGILGLKSFREQLGDYWPNWRGDRLPDCLLSLVDQPGEHILVDRELVVHCEELPSQYDMGLRKLTLRPLTRLDLLTRREREVAQILAGGKSHKETARILGVAPATIRNQTQSIYSKLRVDNRANLAAIVHGHIQG